MNTLIKTLIVLLLLSGHSWAANTLEINGVILESACAISPDNAYQVIDMNIITIKEIERNGRSKNHPLNIKLINCRLKNYKGEKNKLIEMTFFGLDTAQQSLKKKGLAAYY
ncbi:type 1 fimbrial protein [Morganella morganii]|uniref:fimbrial protein n=1 Tax=Morganella morganii TaxID=582 RepID=UPI001C4486C4|nr:fimbrial protein [Morganella morganii]QXO41479.1 type 1 fimbrial protein [Morganella morganii]QXO45177.1 type 1 fimbrial protein [Morganella morganii]QXO67817.1 type 1 fimbrial protein [Morganella morganii]